MAADASEYLAALERRLFNTWTMRRRSAMTQGRSGGRSISIVFRPPPLRKVFLASSTRLATSVGSGVIESEPVSIRATSSRSLIKSRMRSAWWSMIR